MCGHIETILPLYHTPTIPYKRHLAQTPDNDEIAIDFVQNKAEKPLVVFFHGLEGSSQSQLIRHLAHDFLQQEWSVVIPHFRSCGNHMNKLNRAYHASDAKEVAWMLDYIRAYFPHQSLVTIGVSLGGSALLHHLSSSNGFKPQKSVTISTPFDLTACVDKIDYGWRRYIYANYFLKSLKEKIMQKSQQFPIIGSRDEIHAIKTLAAFDEFYTARFHGFANAKTYWKQSSAIHILDKIQCMTLCINALNDPIIPAYTLPSTTCNEHITFLRPHYGGHGKFIVNPKGWLFQSIFSFLQPHSKKE